MSRPVIECSECGAYPLTERGRIWYPEVGPQIRWFCPVCHDWKPGTERTPDPTLFEPTLDLVDDKPDHGAAEPPWRWVDIEHTPTGGTIITHH